MLTWLLATSFTLFFQTVPNFSGRVFDSQTKEALPQCNIVVQPGGFGTSSDSNGRFSLALPAGKYEVSVSYLGYIRQQKKIDLIAPSANLELEFFLKPRPLESEAVIVFGESNRAGTVERIDYLDIRRMPTINSDALRAVKILPGVTSNNELSSAYSVRGGNHDENLPAQKRPEDLVGLARQRHDRLTAVRRQQRSQPARDQVPVAQHVEGDDRDQEQTENGSRERAARVSVSCLRTGPDAGRTHLRGPRRLPVIADLPGLGALG